MIPLSYPNMNEEQPKTTIAKILLKLRARLEASPTSATVKTGRPDSSMCAGRESCFSRGTPSFCSYSADLELVISIVASEAALMVERICFLEEGGWGALRDVLERRDGASGWKRLYKALPLGAPSASPSVVHTVICFSVGVKETVLGPK